MATLSPIFEIVVGAAATLSIIIAIGVYRRVNQLINRVEKHERTLYGSDEATNLADRVASHEAELEERRDE